MAVMSITLEEYLDSGNSREYATDADALLLPKRVRFTRNPAEGNKTVQEYRFVVSHAAVDAVTSEALAERITWEVKGKMPIKASAAALSA